jgi:hypothetical protein
MRRWLALGPFLVLATTCGPSGGSGDGDADGDTITDRDEGGPDTDTDDDGTPDYQDTDSDDDSIPDAIEAGDDDLATLPRNFEGTGEPDFRDLDSDDDTILDLDDGATDFDNDRALNFVDLDSDGDCIRDADEAGGSPPVDTDDDGRDDFLDHDSDDDGIADATEDANCDGMQGGAETSSTDDDSDHDGASDLVETVAGTDPLDPTDNPQANGDFVFVEPYEGVQSPVSDDLDFSTTLVKVDVYVLVDRSNSMANELVDVETNLEAAVSGLQCPPEGTGTPGDCIPDLWAGGGAFGYREDFPFENDVALTPTPDFSLLPDAITTPVTNTKEPEMFALWATATGLGSVAAACANLSPVDPAPSCVGSPADLAGYGTYGYPCFRQGALPVILLATDEAPLTGDTYGCPTWGTAVAPELTSRGIKVVGILGDNPIGNTAGDLADIATATGSLDAANANAPLVFDGAGPGAAAAITTGIHTLAVGLPLDLSAHATDDPVGDSVDAVAAFIDHLETQQLGTPACADGLTEIDTDADSIADAYVDVRTGTPVCWKVVTKPNTTVPATSAPQLVRATVDVLGDAITQLDSHAVYFLVPPAPFDPPID